MSDNVQTQSFHGCRSTDPNGFAIDLLIELGCFGSGIENTDRITG